METMCLNNGISGIVPPISITGSLESRASHVKPPQKPSVLSRFSFRYPSLESLWPRPRGGGGGTGNSRYNGLAIDDAVLEKNSAEQDLLGVVNNKDVVDDEDVEGQNGNNWVLKILDVRSTWKGKRETGGDGNEEEACEVGVANEGEEEEEEACEFCRVDNDDDDDDEEDVQFDRDSFSRMLRKVSLAEARLYAKMSHLGNLAYSIPRIKPGKLMKHYGLRVVTSSIEKRELAAAAAAEKNPQEVESNEKKEEQRKEQKSGGSKISASAAYNIAASAASYLHAQTRSILPFKSSNGSIEGSNESHDSVDINTEVASLMATTDSVTAVVAAKEEVKQAVADDLNSTHSSPCEWFICDNDQSGTRYFVIQGSESLASWQANLLFEPGILLVEAWHCW